MRKRFGGLDVLRSVDLIVRGGELCALIGPNGAGKTTLLNIVSGVLRSDGGEVRIQGKPVHGRAPHAIARLGVSRTFQTEHLFDGMTVLENVMLPLFGRLPMTRWVWGYGRSRMDAAERALAALETAGAVHWEAEAISVLPQGLRRLVDLARSLVTSPILLLLDEPLAGLTPEEMSPVLSALHRVREAGCAVLLVEHNMPAVMRAAERVVVLHGGTCIADGPPAQVSEDPAVITAYLGSARRHA